MNPRDPGPGFHGEAFLLFPFLAGRAAQRGQHRGHQRHPDDEGVDEDADGQAEGDGLDRALALGHEGREDGET